MTSGRGPASHWAPVQIAELLAAMTSQSTVDDALAAVVDGVAETFDAEMVIVVGREGVRRSLGFGADEPPRELVLASREVEAVTGVGRCHVRSVPLNDPELDRLVLARTGGPYGEDEAALLSGVARTIELSLRSVRSLARERELREAAAETAQRQGILVSELRYRAAFDEALLSISQTLLTGDPSSAEAAVGEALERLAGFLELAHARIDVGDDAPWVAWGEQQAGGSTARTVTVPLAARSRPEARLVVVGSSASPFDREGRALLEVVADLIANALDRRETRLALEVANRELLRSNLELERANRDLRAMNAMKDDFVSMTSHELRTPLTAIQGFAETVAERGEHLDPAMTRDLASRIHGQATRLGRLVGDILDISRLESEEVEVATRDVVVRDVVTELLELWPEGDLEVDLADERVRADADHLRRILMNYAENARKYGAPPIRIATRPAGEDLVITVTDEGPGVPAAFRSNLFEKFQQASQGTRRSSTGTGLGLAIVRRLARLNGGEVGYEPAPGGGACFWVRLPTEVRETAPPSSP